MSLDIQKAWENAPRFSPDANGFLPKEAKPLRVEEEIFGAIIDASIRGDGAIRVHRLDFPGKGKRHTQLISWERHGDSRLFSCVTEEPMAHRYRIMLETGSLGDC
ncbi:MAG: hypothetical protein PHW95_04605 [Patescibacteria group bacterium]|nr:hypothetical protein [Patescibacteria group bacterium]